MTLILLLTACGGAPHVAFDQRYTAWDGLLRAHVTDGRVDYAAWHRDGADGLASVIADIEGVSEAEYLDWTRDEQLVLWINTYNAYMIATVLDHYPVDGVLSIGIIPKWAFLNPVVAAPATGSFRKSLYGLENDVIRERFREPRVHFAINCASRSCPALRSRAWTADTLDADLDEAARGFLGDTDKNRYDAAANTLYLSQIFSWYAGDFVGEAGSVSGYVARFAGRDMQAAALAGAPVQFLDYDWSLNGP